MRMRTIDKALVMAMALSGIAALSVAQTATKPAFEVISIKPNASGSQSWSVDFGAHFNATNITARDRFCGPRPMFLLLSRSNSVSSSNRPEGRWRCL